MDNVTIKEFVEIIPVVHRLKLIELIQKQKVSTNFLDRLIEMYSSVISKSWLEYIIVNIILDLEDGLSEEKILWLYSYENEFNQYYFEKIEQRVDIFSVTHAESMLSEFYKIMKDAFNSGATIEQVEVIAMPNMPLSFMKAFLPFLKLGIGLNIDYSEMHYGNKITELDKEAAEKLEQILLNL